MNMHVDTNSVALQRSLPDVVAEYDTKLAAIPSAMEAFAQAGNDLKMAGTIGGTYGRTQMDTGRVYESEVKASLLKSAWYHVYDGLNIDRIASPNDKRLFEQAMASPPPFTMENLRATFGKYIADPRANILRGLAEVFCGLDDFYKSHDKVKIGVAGLPKRIILSNVAGYGSYGRDKLIAVVNALACYQGIPLLVHKELEELDALHRWDGHIAGVVDIRRFTPNGDGEPRRESRGLTVKKFQNGNAHVIFSKDTLRDINMALAEFYGDVLPDTPDEKPTKPEQSRAVSKDLQYYPTPAKLADDILRGHWVSHFWRGKTMLDPSCGDGRLLDASRKFGMQTWGIEVDFARAAEARRKFHTVQHANFLEVVPGPDFLFDVVFMNPPFYGKHYAVHVEHAMKFLKPGGILIAILPVTARYDHQHITGGWKGRWDDLPFGSFIESGTNINTTLFITTKPQEN